MTRSIRQYFLDVRNVYTRIMWLAAVIAMGSLMSISVAQVFCRYVLGFSLIWSEELSRAVMIWITFLFAGLAYNRGEIIAFEVLQELLPKKLAVILQLLGNAAVIILLLLLVQVSWTYAQVGGRQIMPALQVSLFWVYLSLPIGLTVFLGHLVLRSTELTLDLFPPIAGLEKGNSE